MALTALGTARALSRISPLATRPAIVSFAQCRSFSALRTPATTPRSHLHFVGFHPHSLSLSSRQISLGSIFSAKAKPNPTPTPAAIGAIARLEADANAHPYDVPRQLLLFESLNATSIKAGYDVVITRWERMCEFDSESPLLRSDAAFQHYLTALVKAGHEKSVNSAVRRRDALLASSSAATVAQPNITGNTETTDTAPTPAPSASTDTVPTASQTMVQASTSQKVADAVLSGQAPPAGGLAGTGPAVSPDLAKLATALGGGAGISSNPIHVTLSEPKGAWVPRIIRFVILTCVSGALFLVVLSVLLENSGLLKAGASAQSEFEPAEGSKVVKFSDVHGVDEAKEELGDIVEFLKDPTLFSTLGGKLPKGVLLTGPPGTGKTLLARAVAGEAGVPFLFASGSEFDEMFVGVGAKRVRDLFATARKKQPAIIFIDELDAVGGKRSGRDSHYMKQTLNQLLVEMDGFQQDEGVIVIAATNFPESLDQALVRPGRFDRHVSVPLPDIRGRAQILVHHMKDVTISQSLDPMILARGTPGFSGADLQNMINQAAIQASKEGCKEVSLKHFEWAKDRIVMGAESKSRYIDEEVKKMTAYHEGGHALVALYTDGAMPLHKVTCVPRGHALGVTSQLPENDRVSVSLKEYLAEIDVCMGGRVAEEIVYGTENVTSGASSDLKHATSTAKAMVKYWGFSRKVGPVFHHDNDGPISTSKREEIEAEVRSLLLAGEARVAKLLESKKEELHLLAAALVEHETLNMDEVKRVIKGESIRKIEDVVGEDISRMQTEES